MKSGHSILANQYFSLKGNTMIHFFGGRTKNNPVANNAGSTLIWAIVVILVLTITIGMGLLFVQTRFNSAVLDHNENQAYYTAVSSLETISAWISSSENNETAAAAAEEIEKIRKFIESIPSEKESPKGRDLVLGLPSGKSDKLGSCTVNFKFVDEGKQRLLLTATAQYGNATETVTLTMSRGSSSDSLEKAIKIPENPLVKYAKKTEDLNKKKRDSRPVLLGAMFDDRRSSSPQHNKRIQTDDYDKALLAEIKANDLTREAKLESYWVNSSGKQQFPNPDILTIFNSLSWGGGANDPENRRTVVTPANGRLTVNPLRTDYFSRLYSDNTSQKDRDYNARFVSMEVSGTAGKNVELRLGGDERTNSKYASFIGIDFIDQQTKTIVTPNDYVEYLHGGYAVPVTLNNPGSTLTGVTINYSKDLRKNYYYRQLWKSATIYTQATADTIVNRGIDTYLLFTPFYHGYIYGDYRAADGSGWVEGFYDYYGWGARTANPNYGQNSGDAYRSITTFPNGVGKTRKGNPFNPVYYGENFGLYLLDNVGTTATDRNNSSYRGNLAWIQQGVNILGSEAVPSVVYSTRSLTIGGVQKMSATATQSDEGIRTTVGLVTHYMSTDHNVSGDAYFDQLRFGTLFYNTDIILTTPDPKNLSMKRVSKIKAPLRYKDVHQPNGSATTNSWKALDSYYLPKTQIIGGSIYVGTGQSLEIEGGEKLYKNPDGKAWSVPANRTPNNLVDTGEWNMLVAPDYILVDKGATLKIDGSDNFNIQTNIYVNGGTLVIQAGAKIKGTIYCFNNGVVELQGNFDLNAPAPPDGVPESLYKKTTGIYILGDDTVLDGVTSGGFLRLPNPVAAKGIKIRGSSNRVHLLGIIKDKEGQGGRIEQKGRVITVSGGKITSASQLTGILCDNHDTTNGICRHFTQFTQGGWKLELYGS
jgi:hypothetical protein